MEDVGETLEARLVSSEALLVLNAAPQIDYGFLAWNKFSATHPDQPIRYIFFGIILGRSDGTKCSSLMQ
jgi:hypothetical protein